MDFKDRCPACGESLSCGVSQVAETCCCGSCGRCFHDIAPERLRSRRRGTGDPADGPHDRAA
ncbi:MAG: hypothetical protein HY658_02635 [Actinobacteria bacterium]|nr:hypothetical protein [Actinomycetota bacterium]